MPWTCLFCVDLWKWGRSRNCLTEWMMKTVKKAKKKIKVDLKFEQNSKLKWMEVKVIQEFLCLFNPLSSLLLFLSYCCFLRFLSLSLSSRNHSQSQYFVCQFNPRLNFFSPFNFFSDFLSIYSLKNFFGYFCSLSRNLANLSKFVFQILVSLKFSLLKFRAALRN